MLLCLRTAVLIATAWLGLAPLPVLAAEPTDGSPDYNLVAWKRENGLPSGGITALSAAADGALWVGMDTGLYRFDGLRFVQVGAPGVLVTHLRSAADASLWVALGDGSVLRIKDGRTVVYDRRSGLPGIGATALIEDSEQTLWIGTRRGLYVLQGERWVRAALNGLPAELRVNSAAVDSLGNFLLSANNALFRRRTGTNHFEQLASFSTSGAALGICSVSPERVYVTDDIQGFRVIGSPGGPTPPSRNLGFRILCDRRGNVWIGTNGRGLWRIPPQAGAAPSGVLTEMQGEVANALAEDQHGNIWIGTPAALTRLSPNRMVRRTDLGVSTAIEASPDGYLWLGTFDGLIELVPAGGVVTERRRYLPGARVRALHAGDNALWVSTEQGVWKLDLASRTIAPIAPGTAPLRDVDSLSSDRQGTVWIVDAEQGVFTLTGMVLTRVPLPFDVRENPVIALHVDRSNQTWLALQRGVAIVKPGGSIVVREDAGRARTPRRSRSIFEDSRGVIWIGGVNSLSWFSEDQLHVVTQADGFPVDLVKALDEDDAGNFWMANDAAIVRIARTEFERARSDAAAQQVRYERFDAADGAGVPRLLGDPQVAKAPDGMLWFITSDGITGIDPKLSWFGDSFVPKASVVNAIVDGSSIAAAAGAQFSSRTRAVQIDYTALDIDSPHRTRFRYRLRGFDDEWQDAGARTTAFYTNLPPGQYEFEVAASNHINVWGEPTGNWRFEVEPVFYQTGWFPIACVGLVALAGWGVWRLRLAQVAKQFNIVLGERVRLSREIHDTLLQSLVGVAVQCEALAREVEKSPAAARVTLLGLRRQVESHIREFRQAVSDLRAERDDFIAAVRTAGQTAERTFGVHFELVVKGRRRSAPENVERQLIKIAREAISNAARHAGATTISTEVHYDDTSLVLRVNDDGRGFNLEESIRTSEGHCGLTSMKERADEIGARLSIASAPGTGTHVEAAVRLSPE